MRESVRDVLDACARSEHVVSAPVEREVSRPQREGRLQLLLDDRPDEFSANCEVGVLDAAPPRIRPPLGD